MNWETLGDSRSLFVYDIMLNVCKNYKLPLLHVTMLTKPRSKSIQYGKTDKFRAGHLNHKLVTIMEKCLYGEKKKDFDKGREYAFNPTTHAKGNDRLFTGNSEQLDYMFAVLANYFKHEGVNFKMIFKRKYRGRNTIGLRKIEYFSANNRDEYFHQLTKKLDNKIPQILFFDPDKGIKNDTSEQYIREKELSHIMDIVHKNTVIAVKFIKTNYNTKSNKILVLSEIQSKPLFVFDKTISTGIIFLCKNTNSLKSILNTLKDYQSEYAKFQIELSY